MTVHAHQISNIALLITFTLASVTADPAWAHQDAAMGAGLPAFLVNESQAVDLNADGDAVDAVLHVFDTKQRMTVNLGLAAASICRAVLGPPFTTCDPVSPVIGRTVVAFLVAEPAQGETDLNGDGDAVFDKAIGAFSMAYADQNEKDHAALDQAIRSGKLEAVFEEQK